jgi:hypothetical protein
MGAAMTHRKLLGLVTFLLVMLCATDITSAAQKAFIPGSNFCLPNYKKWQKRDRHWKAFALNNWNSGGQICGWASGYPTKQSAVSRAMKECRKNSTKSPSFGLKNSCYIYDVK